MEPWVFTSSLMIGIPNEMGEKIDQIRVNYDKAYGRWMPHLNVIYPFLEENEDDESLYQEKLKEASEALQNHPRLSQFVMWFDHLSSFPQPEGMQSVHLVPKTDPPEALQQLRKFLTTILVDPHPKKRSFNPHLTIGQWDKSVAVSDIEKLFPDIFDEVLHVPFTVKQLTAISRRTSDAFQPKLELMLKENQTITSHWEAQLGPASSAANTAQYHNVVYVPEDADESMPGTSQKPVTPDVMVQLVIPQEKFGITRTKKIVLVCDTSGSMSTPNGIPKQQVLSVVEQLEKEGCEFSIINYSSLAITTAGSWEALNSRWQGSTTAFRKAFSEMIRFMETHQGESIEFIFLTDGEATDKPFDATICASDKNFYQLAEAIKRETKKERSIIVHTFGLGATSDLTLLEQLRRVGSEHGVYTFASAKNGGDEITTELMDMISFSRLVDYDISVDAGAPQPCKFSKVDDNHMETVLWLESAPNSILIYEKNSGHAFTVDDFVRKTASKTSTQYLLSKLRRDMADVSDPEVVLHLERRLEKLRLDCPRRDRAVMFTECLQVGRELDELRTLLMSKTKGTIYKNSELLSRLNAMAFKGKMRKARRRRLLDARMLANQELVSSIDGLLEALPVPTEIPDALAELRDDISQDTLRDILTLSKQDLLMIGLQVKRDELTVDQPVCISVKLCTTMVSWLTLENAATFEIAKGNVDATGTFDISAVTKLLTGTSNEIINAGLPIYGCEEHYQRIRIWMPVICGHFFTLNEMGFSAKQILALYAILARLHRHSSNDRASMFVEQFRLLLARIAHDLPLLQILKVPKTMQPIHVLRRFTIDPNARNKSELPTLDIIAGLILALRPAQGGLVPSCSTDDRQQENLIPATMPAMLVAETLRRHLNATMISQGGGAEHFHGMVRRVIFGDQKANFPVEVEVPARFDAATSTFTTCQFLQYQPLKPPEAIRFKEEDLEVQNVPLTAAGFLNKFTNFPFESLDEEMYQRILPSCVLQAAWGANNDRFREMIDLRLTILDPIVETEQTQKLLLHIAGYFDTERRQRWTQACADQLDEEMALSLIHDMEVNEFVCSLRTLAIGRGQRLWKKLVEEITNRDTYENILGNHEKLAIMLFGKHQDEPLIEGGATWMVGPICGSFVREKLTPIYALRIEALDTESTVHQYRASDIPNRHGHHQSFPLWVHYKEHPSIASLKKKWDL